ncbi:uncharacterized protein ISCGN_026923 [Ixodes scapularis]
MENIASKSRRNSRYCCVVNCHNSEANTKGKVPLVKFYSFPGKWYETDRRDAWVRAVRRTGWANRSRSAACNLTPPPPLEPSSPEASELPESEGSPDSDLEQDLLLLADVAWDVQPLPLTAEMETQTDAANSRGPLQLMLSATDGALGSTQVTHIPQADKVTHPEKPWARRCGFLGYESMKTSEHLFQDLCCVTATVFTVLLNMLPEQRYRVYGGRHSDSFITRDSGFLTLVEPGDDVMCDKGFPAIKTTVAEEGAILVMPPFNVGGGQLSKQDMEDTLTIAQVRVHVERAIQRLKLHNVLTNRVPLSLIPHMEKVMKVCGGLVNMQSPIIRT